jgi:calcineurin-like phosphoesterase family protein
MYYSSDLHINHANIIKYCPNSRGHFNTTEEMNITIIENWNKKIKPDDDVAILGDVFFGDKTYAREVLRQLNGNKILVFGNHDNRIRNNPEFLDEFFLHYDDMFEIETDGLKVVLCHYPYDDLLLKSNKAKDLEFDIFLHGHKHSNSRIYREGKLIMDCGLDGNNLMPYSWDEIKKIYKEDHL